VQSGSQASNLPTKAPPSYQTSCLTVMLTSELLPNRHTAKSPNTPSHRHAEQHPSACHLCYPAATWSAARLELISEMVSEQNPNACQMNKADVVFDLILIAHCNPAIAQQPAVQAFNLPSPLVSPQRPTILRFRSGAIATMWSDHLDATLSQCSIQRVRVIRLVANQTFGFIRHKISVGSTSWDSCGEALDT
jgi:hypothetical protein